MATGKSRLAVSFPRSFQIGYFRASFADNDGAFVVTRTEITSHIVMLDRFMGSQPSAVR